MKTRNKRLDSKILASRFSTLGKSVHRVESRFTVGLGHRVGMRYIGSDGVTHYFLLVVFSEPRESRERTVAR